MSTVLKCIGSDDVLTIRADNGSSDVHFVVEKKKYNCVAEFSLKLLNIDVDGVGLPVSSFSVWIVS